MGDLIMTLRSKLSVSVLVAASALSAGVAWAESNAVKAGDVGAGGQWYGRAGGTVGSDRVQSLKLHTSSNAALGISWDAEVAARTNMSSDRAPGAGVGVSYDKDVAARTNMPRGASDVQAVGIEGRQAN